MCERLRQALRYGQGIVGIKRSDVILTSFPKSGNTWVRFFFCNLIRLNEGDGGPADFIAVDRTMPELGVDNLMHPWTYRTIPRIVKTHNPFWPVFQGCRAILVLRDPRDAMVSYYHYEKALSRPRFTGDFSAFIRHRRFGFRGWFRHYMSWRDRCTVVLRFEDLLAEDLRAFRRLLKALGIAADPARVEEAVRRSRFARLRAQEQKSGLSHPAAFRSGFTFTRQGRRGGWREYFSESDTACYERIKAEHGFTLY